MRQVQQGGSSHSWKRGKALVHKRPAGEILSALAGPGGYSNAVRKALRRARARFKSMHDKSAMTNKTFATREDKPQGLEENLASSACAISAIKLCTDDCGCQPRTFRPWWRHRTGGQDRRVARDALRSGHIVANRARGSRRRFAQYLALNAWSRWRE